MGDVRRGRDLPRREAKPHRASDGLVVLRPRLAGSATTSRHGAQRVAAKIITHFFLAVSLRLRDGTQRMSRAHGGACGGYQCFGGRLSGVTIGVGLCAQPGSGGLGHRGQLSDQCEATILILRKHERTPPIALRRTYPVKGGSYSLIEEKRLS